MPQIERNPSQTRLLHRASLAVAALAAATALGASQDAQAFTQYNAKNPSQLGTAVYYKVEGSSNFLSSSMLIPGPEIRRSSAYGNRKVVVTRTLYKSYPTIVGRTAWTVAASKATSAILKPGAKRTWSHWNVAVNAFWNYRVVYKVSYYRTDGSFVGSISTDYRHTGDYQCNTGDCSVQAGPDGRATMLLTY
jgi:hypothetical protein